MYHPYRPVGINTPFPNCKTYTLGNGEWKYGEDENTRFSMQSGAKVNVPLNGFPIKIMNKPEGWDEKNTSEKNWENIVWRYGELPKGFPFPRVPKHPTRKDLPINNPPCPGFPVQISYKPENWNGNWKDVDWVYGVLPSGFL